MTMVVIPTVMIHGALNRKWFGWAYLADRWTSGCQAHTYCMLLYLYHLIVILLFILALFNCIKH